MSDTALTTLTAKDFTTDQEVRWCPGCGDYAILTAVRKALPRLELAREDYVFVSGIGCAARFPYYMNTYGMHTIHGRAPAFATGVKLANPDLEVWLVSGDGDLLSIGVGGTTGLGITASYDTGTGVMSMTGTASVSNYQTLLRRILYNNTSGPQNVTSRTVNFVPYNGATAGSTAVATITIT